MTANTLKTRIELAQATVLSKGLDEVDPRELALAIHGWDEEARQRRDEMLGKTVADGVAAGIEAGVAKCMEKPEQDWRGHAKEKGPWFAIGAAITGGVVTIVEIVTRMGK